MPMRPAQGRLVAGVCAALAGQLGVDVALVRLAFMLLTFAWGIGLLLYIALWLLLPNAGDVDSPRSIRMTARRNIGTMRDELRDSGRRLGDVWRRAGQRPSTLTEHIDRRTVALGLVALGGILFLGAIGALDWLTPVRVIGLLAIAAGIVVLVTFRDR